MRAQQQFESYRRRQLPITYGRSAASDCDVRIGRFCYWHDDTDDPPAEPERIGAARAAFVRALDSLGALTPDDTWLVGQRVRYLVEAGRPADALRAAAECRAAAWWCDALAGFAHHSLGAYHAADSVFARSVAALPDKERCTWTDLTKLLPDGFAKAYARVPCARRDSINAVVWWLADPLWSEHGNDLRTEHYARLTMTQLVQQARSAHDLAWGADMAQLMLRYGWPTAWSRSPPSTYDAGRVSVIGHEASPSFEFIPSARALQDPLRAEARDWVPLAARPTTRYAPLYARHLRELTPQIAWFSRGDSAVLVIAYDVREAGDTVFIRDSVAASVALSRGPSDLAVARAAIVGRHGALVVPSARSPALVSVEVRDSALRALARGRLATRPPSDSAISDLMLFERDGDLPDTFERAAARALGTLRVSRSAPFGLYWELYGPLAAASDVTYALTVERVSASMVRRLAERIRLAQPVRPVRQSFDEARATASRSLLVDVSHIPAGKYRLTLRVTAGARAASASREIDVR